MLSLTAVPWACTNWIPFCRVRAPAPPTLVTLIRVLPVNVPLLTTSLSLGELSSPTALCNSNWPPLPT
ncbi:hypothetical protein D3C71_1073370 [compost metagenome]